MLNGIKGGILAVAGIEAARTTDDFFSPASSALEGPENCASCLPLALGFMMSATL